MMYGNLRLLLVVGGCRVAELLYGYGAGDQEDELNGADVGKPSRVRGG